MAGQALDKFIGNVFNALPDRVNLFARYATRYGGRNLELDPSTLSDLRNAVSEQNRPWTRGERIKGVDDQGNEFEGFTLGAPIQGPIQPRSGPVIPYLGKDKSVTNTLGRFTADVDLTGNRLRMTDTYDMENESEDPDLVSGRFQPLKAFNQLEAIYNPAAAQRNFRRDASRRLPDQGYDLDKIKQGGYSSTSSPMTQLGRALLYLSPVKPKPFDIDVTVPVSGRIGN